MKNTHGESLLVFYPTNNESNHAYIFKIKGDVIHHDFSPKNYKGGLQLSMKDTIGSFLDQLKEQLDIYTFTRLVTSSSNVILF